MLRIHVFVMDAGGTKSQWRKFKASHNFKRISMQGALQARRRD
jgi:hypothetical protein